MPDKSFRVDRIKVEIYTNRVIMGKAAARAVGEQIRRRLCSQEHVSIIFAAAPSQDEFLAALADEVDIDWQRVIAFHMDEYVGLPPDAPQSFRSYLTRHLSCRIPLGRFHYLDGNASNPDQELVRYATLLSKFPLDIACVGIGENGHLAFNDPPADFEDPARLRIVELTERSRQQQVNDGCFKRIEEVPKRALTVTIPVLLSSSYISCVVPSSSKALAVREMLSGPVSGRCPASILRQHPNAVLYLEPDSAACIP